MIATPPPPVEHVDGHDLSSAHMNSDGSQLETDTAQDNMGEGSKGGGGGGGGGGGPGMVQVACGKIVYFCYLGTLGSVENFYAVFFRQMGFGPSVIGVIFGARPLMGTLVSPLWGMLADRLRMRRLMFGFALVAYVVMVAIMVFLNPAKRVDTCPEECLQRNATNSCAGIDPDQKEKLLENISWLYESSSLERLVLALALVVLVGEVFQAPSGVLLDAGLFVIVGKAGAVDRHPLKTYGAMRSMGSIGWGISTLVTGALLSNSRHKEVVCDITLYFSDYRIILYVCLVFTVVGILLTVPLKFDPDETAGSKGDGLSTPPPPTPPSTAIRRTKLVLRTFNNVHYASWFVVTFIGGCASGLFVGFAYWYLETLGANQLLMGLDSMIQCICEFITFYFVEGLIINRIGHMAVVSLSLFVYAVHYVGYALVVNPWCALPLAVIRGYTYAALWTSIMMYFTMAVPPSSFATTTGIIYSVFWCLGQGSGKLIGGLLVGAVGAVATFYIGAGCCAATMVLFLLIQKFSRKPDMQKTPAGYEEIID